MNEPQVLNPLKGQTDNGWHYEQEVYDAEGIARAVKAGGGSGNIPKVIEPQVLTPKRTEEGKRIRKDYESHKVTKQRKEMQQLEPREDGVSNTLTTAQKDNYLMEPIMYQRAEKVMRENEVQEGDTINPYNETLNDTGTSPTLTTRPEGNKTAIFVVVKDNPTISIPSNTAEGYVQCEVGGVLDISYPSSTTRRGRVQDGGAVAPTLTCGCETTHARIEEWKTIVGNKQMNPFRGSVEEESPCITSACGCGGGMTPMVTNADLETTKTKEFIEQMRGHKQMQYRIRKLTERECFRLMGVTDENSDKIREVVSKSQCYKLAGNSIVVDVMVHMFDQLFFGNKNTNQQLELF